MNITVRPYHSSDFSHLAQVYKQGIVKLGPTRYTNNQVVAWSSFADDTDDFRKWINHSTIFVAVDLNMNIVGFACLETNGRISSLFVAPEVMRKGVGTALLNYLIKEINLRDLNSFTTDASEFSKPLFEKFGFTVKKLEHTQFKGVQFTRYQMILIP
ncbi:MAG: GNAT family N-acetyltransferase [Gammaproteobacteria bacterium]|jgi:putative acetyltransferase